MSAVETLTLPSTASPEPTNQRVIRTNLTYLSASHDRNEQLWYKRPPPQNITKPPPNESTNYIPSVHEVAIQDVRGHELEYSLDTHGFAFGRLDGVASNAKLLNDIRDDEEGEFIKDVYYPQIEKALKKKTGAERVLVFDHLVRKKPPEGVPEIGREAKANLPVQAVHIDQSREYAYGFLERTLKDHVSDMVTKRAQIVNVWRPLIDEVEDFPLAVLDNRTMDDASQLHPAKAIYTNNSNLDRAIYHVSHHPDHLWYFLSKQKKNECVFIKCFDTKQQRGTASCAPHTSFANPNARPNAPPRESIEIRAWVLYAGDDESEQVEIKTVPEWQKPRLRWTSRWFDRKAKL